MLRWCLPAALLVSLPLAAQVEFSQVPKGVVVRINGREFSTLHFGEDRHKPYLHPLRSATGKVVTRGFPVDPQPGESTGQPHQLGLWVGHERLNGVDYFEVESADRLPRKVGHIAFKDVTQATGGASQGVLAFAADWVHPDGTAVLREKRRLTFYALPDVRQVDVEVVLHANQQLVFSDHADGVLGLRLGLPFEERSGGTVRNALGDTGPDGVYGKRSPWMDLQATVDGEPVGVAVFDHPKNHNFPARWKVRSWASLFLSPFAEREFYHEKPFKGSVPKDARDATFTLEEGEELRLLYRVLIHPAATDIDAAWRNFAQVN